MKIRLKRCIRIDVTNIKEHIDGTFNYEFIYEKLINRYRQASKKDKGIMLDEYCATSKHYRKHAIKH